MLINFSVSNFASFKNNVTLSMEKTAIQQHPEHILDKRVLSGVALYGANASGKTNLLRAIGFVPMFAYPNSVLQLNALNSFMQQSNVPTEFEIEFESNGVNYIYKISYLQNYTIFMKAHNIFIYINSIFRHFLLK